MIINAKLLAVKHGAYTIYVFKNIDDGSYVMCTKLPNWQSPVMEIGDEGFLKYEKVVAGQQFFNPATNSFQVYNYSNIYFENFVGKSEITNSNIIL